MDTQHQIDRLIELAIVQRTELRRLVEELPQLKEHLSAEIERTFEDAEPQIRSELEEFVLKHTNDRTATLGEELTARVNALGKTLEESAQAKYSALIAERAKNDDLLKQAEQNIALAAQALPAQVKEIVTAELARFPRAGEIDRLRKEFQEPRGLNPRGKWTSGERYNKLDLVSYNGDSFVSNIDGNTERPNRSSEVWTLSAARGVQGGGGGITSIVDLYNRPAPGEVLIGNGTDYQNATLTAGEGITITNGSGSITIDASVAQGYLNLQAKNGEASAITRGQVVYISGASGSLPQVKLAINTGDITSTTTIGVVADASIAPGDTGVIRCVGEVKNVNTAGFNAGDLLYLGGTAGSITNVKPVAPAHMVQIGICEKVNAVSGEIYVFVQNGYELDELHNVLITSVQNGQALVYDSATQLWKNSTTINGTAIPASKTLVVTTDKLSALASTTSAELAGVISDETGSGSLVFANTPTLVTPNIGAATGTSVNLSGAGTFGGNLTVSGTGTSSVAGKLIAGSATADYAVSKLQSNGALVVYGGAITNAPDAPSIVIDQQVSGVARIMASGTNTWSVPLCINPYGGNVLLGTTTDSANGKLQLATHTTSAGGIGFGTDTSLYRTAANTLRAGSGSSYLLLAPDSATGNFQVYRSGADAILRLTKESVADWDFFAGTDLVIKRNNTTALTLASTGDATFAGTVKATKNGGYALSSTSNSGKAGVGFLGTNGNTDERNWASVVNYDAWGDFCIVPSASQGADPIGQQPVLAFSKTGSLKLNKYGAGTLTTDASGNVTASSDARLKTNLRTFARGLADVLKLVPKTYNWNEASGLETSHDYVGFVAQDVVSAIPEAVYEGRGDEKILTLNDRAILAALVNAVKELNAKIA